MTEADAVFAALADPTRRQVMRHISEQGEASASELAARLPISRQAVAKHLNALGDAGLVASDVRGRERRYRLTPEPMSAALSWMVDVGAAWDERLEALKRLVAED
jgi:ArsR family transcriptional regulator, cadmium/lead-responsive transcriptional repressor